MSAPNPDDSLLLIRCPSCGQRFKVGDDLRERTVECGGCESRFKINDEVIVRGKRVYPGERAANATSRFQRVPMPAGDAHIGVQPMFYSNMPDPAVLEPMSPQRIIAGGVGVFAMIIIALMLMFGGGRGGMLDGMETPDRLLMAGFVSVLGIVLLIYANPKARLKGGAVGVLFAAGLMVIPFFFKTGSVKLPEGTSAIPSEIGISPGDLEEKPVEDASILDLRKRAGTKPLVAEIEKLATEGSTLKAMGVWFHGLEESNKFVVRDYLLRVTKADPSSHLYPRNKGEWLMVISGVSISYTELAELVAPLGNADSIQIHPDVSLVEITVNNEIFKEGPLDKLTDKNDPAFYDLNKRELESVDLNRVKQSVQRLVDSEPKIYRADITRKLISLLGDPAVDFKKEVCGALAVWSEAPGPAGEAALTEVKKLVEAKAIVPVEIVALAVKEKTPGIIPLLDQLWLKSPSDWESTYADFGPAVEDTVLRRFPETQGTVRYSAIRILGRVGGADSIPVLDGSLTGAGPELKVIIEQAKRSIQGRLGR